MTPRVLLASMPWGKLNEPTLALSILSRCLSDADIEHTVRYFNMYLLESLRADSYTALADINGLSEFLFTYPLEPHLSARQLDVLFQMANRAVTEDAELASRYPTAVELVDLFLLVRNDRIPALLDFCAAEVLSYAPDLVGLTCMFDQTLASIALATKIKELSPSISVVLGGYALEGPAAAQVLQSFECIDAVCLGDGEPAIVALAHASTGDQPWNTCPNLLLRGSATADLNLLTYDGTNSRQCTTVETPRQRINLNDSPVPRFDGYFDEVATLEKLHSIRIEPSVLPIETSRGCWWGQKSHCTFCGIDEETLKYRQKDEDRVLAMFDILHAKYPHVAFRLVDYILPLAYFKTLLPQLAERTPKLRLACETKANLKKWQVEELVRAGFVEIQPGIESFSSPVLKRMAKGVTGIQNAYLMRLAKERGIKVDWNLLYDFPDDTAANYWDLVDIIPRLYHLDPPFNCSGVFLTRFAPMHERPDDFGLPAAKYHEIYDLWFSEEWRVSTGFDLNNMCYFFEQSWSNSSELEHLYKVVGSQVEHWKAVAGASESLLEHTLNGTFRVRDRRLGRETVRNYPIEFWDVYQHAHDEIATIADVVARSQLPEEIARGAVDTLISDRILFKEKERVVGLLFSVTDGMNI